MSKKWGLFLLSLNLMLLPFSGWPQQISKKKDIAVFNLSYYRWRIPAAVLGSIDDQIRSVFVNLGRFNVIGLTYRLAAEDVNDFIEKIKQFKSENAVVPEKVQMGQEYFTQEDMNRLIGSFIVVIPSVTDYAEDRTKEGGYTVSIRTSFTFINVETITTVAQFLVETTGADKKRDAAVKSAVDDIPDRLTFEIRKLPEFQLKTGILEVHGGEAILEFGRNMGITVGDEYQVMTARVLSSGRQVTGEKGLLMVREVDEEVSYATILYSNGTLETGDQLKEVPRFGTDSTPFARAIVLGADSIFGFPPFLVGVRQTLSRGFYSFRPFIEVELPLNLLFLSNGLPLNISLGVEYNLYLGRLQLAPWLAGGVGIDVPLSQDQSLQYTYLGGSLGIGASYLFSADMKVTIQAGYSLWRGSSGPSYGGVFVGGGLTIKF
jgi:hypothetical protein